MRPSTPLGERAAPAELVAVMDELLASVVAPAGPEGVSPELWDRVLVRIARELVARPSKQIRARLVALAFELAGGAGAPPPAIPQLVELVHAGALLIDDVQDGAEHRRGGPALHRVHGQALAINTGGWLYFAAYHLIGRAGLPEAVALDLHRRLTRTMLRGHQGQALDLAIDVTELRQQEIAAVADAAAALKTGELMRLAAELGALAAGAPAPILAALSTFGSALGVGLQHLDDLAALHRRRDKAREDLRGRRLTWPWAYLAGELDPIRFRGLQRALREAADQDLDSFAAELAGLLGDGARRRASAPLAHARDRLAAQFPRHAALVQLDAEIARLEHDAG